MHEMLRKKRQLVKQCNTEKEVQEASRETKPRPHVTVSTSPVRVGVSLPESDTHLVPGAFEQSCATEIFHHCSVCLLFTMLCRDETKHTNKHLILCSYAIFFLALNLKKSFRVV